jgi:hypothetical protein
MKALWVANAALLVVALGIALFATGQDAAGRAVAWFFPLAFGAALAASWGAERAGAHRLAIALGVLGPLAAGALALTVGRTELAARAEASGAAYWKEPGMRAMARAIAAGDTAAMRAAARGLDLEAEGAEGQTLVTFAVARRPEMVPPLLALGARPDHSPEGTTTPLARALAAPGPAFDALLAAGADPNGDGENQGVPILFAAIRAGRRDRYDALVARGADVTRVDGTNRTTLVAAAEAGQWGIARDLLARGVDPSVVASYDVTLATVVERSRESHAGDPDFQAVAARVAAARD